MKIIGEKLSNDEMLSVKGGQCYTCTCNDGSGAWLSEYVLQSEMDNDIAAYCYDIGNGGGGSCIPLAPVGCGQQQQ